LSRNNYTHLSKPGRSSQLHPTKIMEGSSFRIPYTQKEK